MGWHSWAVTPERISVDAGTEFGGLFAEFFPTAVPFDTQVTCANMSVQPWTAKRQMKMSKLTYRPPVLEPLAAPIPHIVPADLACS